MWHKFENKPKTTSSAAAVPVVRQLREALELHKARVGKLATPDSPIFASGIGTPLSLANLAKRVIVPAIERCVHCRKPKAAHKTDGHLFSLDKTLCWHGWHGYRRSLATNLHALGVPDREIQQILRHSNIAVTMASYVKCLPESRINALDLVAAEMENTEPCNQNATEPKGPVN